MTIQFDIEQLSDGVPSDQFREVVEQVNLRLRSNMIPMEDAARLIQLARKNEILAKYFGVPLETGSAQTLQVEGFRNALTAQARK